MTVEVHIENIFPTPIYFSSIDISDVNVSGEEYIRGGPESYMVWLSKNFEILHKEEFKFVKDQIDDHAKHFFHGVLGYSDQAYPEMTTSWIVKSEPGQYGTYHLHCNSIFSGVVYLTVGENCGDLNFMIHSDDPRRPIQNLTPRIRNETPYTATNYLVSPKTGMLVMFPSNLRHRVDKNTSNETRISIAFNYFLRGELSLGEPRLDLLRL